MGQWENSTATFSLGKQWKLMSLNADSSGKLHSATWVIPTEEYVTC